MTSAPTLTRAIVRERRRSGPYLVYGLEAPDVAAAAQPGQFVSVAQHAPGHLLRRPFSILDVRGDVVDIGFDVVGDGTAWIAQRRPGDDLDVAGPLGTAYDLPESLPGVAVCVGGGYGAAPLFFLARRLRERGIATHAILGAGTADRLFEVERARFTFDDVTLTTDDGSAGIQGRVTDAMPVDGTGAVYACGPMPMLAAVTAAAPRGVPVQVAVEEYMACGIGVCWTCVVPTHDDGYKRHLRSCVDGPVFDGRLIAWP